MNTTKESRRVTAAVVIGGGLATVLLAPGAGLSPVKPGPNPTPDPISGGGPGVNCPKPGTPPLLPRQRGATPPGNWEGPSSYGPRALGILPDEAWRLIRLGGSRTRRPGGIYVAAGIS